MKNIILGILPAILIPVCAHAGEDIHIHVESTTYNTRCNANNVKTTSVACPAPYDADGNTYKKTQIFDCVTNTWKESTWAPTNLSNMKTSCYRYVPAQLTQTTTGSCTATWKCGSDQSEICTTNLSASTWQWNGKCSGSGGCDTYGSKNGKLALRLKNSGKCGGTRNMSAPAIHYYWANIKVYYPN